MILKAEQVARELREPKNPEDPLIITPTPDLAQICESGSASVDIRLGCWFLACRQTRIGLLDVYENPTEIPSEAKMAKTYYVPFGRGFVLHPKAFVLGATLEWIRLPANRAAYIIGRSSWGRHGLIIATATGVHPGFTGCLTLELSNAGEIPITIKPGTAICQIFIHEVKGEDTKHVDQSIFIGRRKPILGVIELDETATRLAKGSSNPQ